MGAGQVIGATFMPLFVRILLSLTAATLRWGWRGLLRRPLVRWGLAGALLLHCLGLGPLLVAGYMVLLIALVKVGPGERVVYYNRDGY